MRTNARNLIATGLVDKRIFAWKDIEFDPEQPYTCCLVCGTIYQTADDRNGGTRSTSIECYWRRKRWAENHAKTHTEKEHYQLFMSGYTMTAQAAQRLAAYGIVPFGDMVLSEETASALAEASAIPMEDVCITR